MRWHLREDIKCNEKRVVVRDKPRGKTMGFDEQPTNAYLFSFAYFSCKRMLCDDSKREHSSCHPRDFLDFRNRSRQECDVLVCSNSEMLFHLDFFQ